jgi:hypothetical protein
MVKAAAMLKVREFQDFDEDNDPHQEHDFGSFELCQRTFVFKIDCFDPSKQFASDDPADPAKTARVLTIMLADEW